MRRFQNNRGFTILEVSIAMTMIAVALLALMHAIISSMQLVESNRMDARAMNLARQKIAEIEDVKFGDILSTYKNYSMTQDVLTLKVLFPLSGSGNLDETVPNNKFFNAGMPRDLNGDGDASDTNVSAGYTLLPVKVQVTWDSVQGQRSVEFNTIMTNYK